MSRGCVPETREIIANRRRRSPERTNLGNSGLRQCDQSAVETSVATRWIAPRHVGRQAVALDPPPGSNVAKGGASPLENPGQIFGGDRSKFETGLFATGGNQILRVNNRVFQTANTGHDGNR